MKLGRVIGNVVSVKKVNSLNGFKLLVIEYLNDRLERLNKTAVCTDTVSAGEGDIVLVCSSSSARFTRATRNVCTDNTIVGIVTTVSKGNKYIYKNHEEEA